MQPPTLDSSVLRQTQTASPHSISSPTCNLLCPLAPHNPHAVKSLLQILQRLPFALPIPALIRVVDVADGEMWKAISDD